MNSAFKRLLIFYSIVTAYVCPLYSNPHPSVLCIVFMAARNDLLPYVERNIEQLKTTPDTEHVKVFVRLDLKKPGKESKTRQFFIEQNARTLVGSQEYKDSGDENALVETIRTAYTAYPADKVVLIIWNHGTGPVEPDALKALNPSDLFHFNSLENRIELERSTGFLEHITKESPYTNETKGICFDDTSGNYLTIAKLTRALERISTEILKKKLSILACDACLMAGIDVISGLSQSVELFVGSQEVILGTGYNYDTLLEPLILKKIPCNELFACHVVSIFKETYGAITEDYTQCAIDLSLMPFLEKNIDNLAVLLIEGLENQKDKSVKAALRKSRHKRYCTTFKEPTYVDLDNFYENLQDSVNLCSLTDEKETDMFRQQLLNLLVEGRALMKCMVKANVVGKQLHRARGLSIYFPEYLIHNSYFNNCFAAQKTHWLAFLEKYKAT